MSDLKKLAKAEIAKVLKASMLDKDAECYLHERGNSYNDKQARKSDQS